MDPCAIHLCEIKRHRIAEPSDAAEYDMDMITSRVGMTCGQKWMPGAVNPETSQRMPYNKPPVCGVEAHSGRHRQRNVHDPMPLLGSHLKDALEVVACCLEIYPGE